MAFEEEKTLIASRENWFCPLPFYHVYSNSGGGWAACCLGETKSDVDVHNVSLMDWWNSDNMNNLRKEMLGLHEGDSYIKDNCIKCVKQETMQGFSTRQKWEAKLIERISHENSLGILQTINDFIDNGEINFDNNFNRFLELKLRIFGNLCNLSCYMCWPMNSSTRIKDINKMDNLIWVESWGVDKLSESTKRGNLILGNEESLPFAETINQLGKLAKNIAVIKITGGEPLMLKNHYDLLDSLVASGDSKYIQLKYQTNFTKFDASESNFQEYISKFKSIQLSISLDSVDEYEEYVRKGSNAAAIEKNLFELKAKFPNTSIMIANTVSLLTIFTFNRFRERYKNFEIEHFLLAAPDWLSIRHLPDPIKQRFINEIDDSRIITLLKNPRDEKQFQKALQYCLDLDVLYKRSNGLFKLWPELEQFYDNTQS